MGQMTQPTVSKLWRK